MIQASMPPKSGARSPTVPPTFRLAFEAEDSVATVAVGPDGCTWVADGSVGSAVAELPQAANNNNRTEARIAAARTGNRFWGWGNRCRVGMVDIFTSTTDWKRA